MVLCVAGKRAWQGSQAVFDREKLNFSGVVPGDVENGGVWTM